MPDLVIMLPQYNQDFSLRMEYVNKLLAENKRLVLEEKEGKFELREISAAEAMKMVW